LQKYSLATLYEARQSAVQDAEKVVAQRRVDNEKADSQRKDAQARLAEFQARIQAQAQSELRWALEGKAIVADLRVGASFRAAAQNELDGLTLALERAESIATEHKLLLMQAEHQVELLQQELAIVERHRDKFLAEARRTEEAKAEEDAAELWQAHQSAYPREGSK
jgi:hypothetical protein